MYSENFNWPCLCVDNLYPGY